MLLRVQRWYPVAGPVLYSAEGSAEGTAEGSSTWRTPWTGCNVCVRQEECNRRQVPLKGRYVRTCAEAASAVHTSDGTYLAGSLQHFCNQAAGCESLHRGCTFFEAVEGTATPVGHLHEDGHLFVAVVSVYRGFVAGQGVRLVLERPELQRMARSGLRIGANAVNCSLRWPVDKTPNVHRVVRACMFAKDESAGRCAGSAEVAYMCKIEVAGKHTPAAPQ